MIPAEMLLNAFVLGILVGGLYAIISLGISMGIGLLNISNLAHVGFMLLASYGAYTLNAEMNLDPIVAGAMLSPFFFILGYALYVMYYKVFERRIELPGTGLVFLFGLLVILEMVMYALFGITERGIYTYYSMQTITIGFLRLPLRILYPFILCFGLVIAIYFFLTRTRLGIALRGVGLDEHVIACVGCDPLRAKSIIFGLSLATASLAGGFLIAAQPISPYSGRQFIGIAFAVGVIGGMGNIFGTFLAALLLGVLGNLVTALYGSIWGAAISFMIALLVLLIRPKGLLRR